MTAPRRSATPPPSAAPTERFLARGMRIIYEDDDLLIIDKPTGIITADPAAASGRPAAKAGNTVFDIVKKHVKAGPVVRARRGNTESRGRPAGPRAWIIHRLDKEASGLLVFAKSEPCFRWLKEELRSKRIHRRYVAVAEGKVGEPGDTGTFQSFIKDDQGPAPLRGERAPKRRGVVTTDDDQGKLAVTHYRVIATASNRTLLEITLDTGRKNQIRVHFGEKGFPLVGDRKFGAKTDAIGRLALHAAELGVVMPGSGQALTFRSPAPTSFYRCVGATPPAIDTPPPLPPPPTPTVPAPDAPRAPSASPPPRTPAAKTSWDQVAGWYDSLLEEQGNDHYDQVILPGTLRLLEPRPGMRLLDVACGQGILCRKLATLGVETFGIEASPQLIDAARRRSAAPPRGAAPLRFEVGDARDFSSLKLSGFDSATCIMALSNLDPLEPVMRNIAAALKPGGTLVWVITHPAFRAPDQTAWGWDDKAKRQYRRVDGYLSPGQKKIEMHPGKAARGGESVTTWTFHRPLQAYFEAMSRAGLLVERMEEWPSLRASDSGPRAAEENRSRREIPLFVAVRARHVGQPAK